MFLYDSISVKLKGISLIIKISGGYSQNIGKYLAIYSGTGISFKKISSRL